MRHYELTVELLAWHEAGHAALIEGMGDQWVDVRIDPKTGSGLIRISTQSPTIIKPFDADNAPRSVIGASNELKSMSRRMAIPYFAGIAAELFYLGKPFTPEAFSDAKFHDFAVARWLLSLTDSEADYPYCARVAFDLVMAYRTRIEQLARQLLESGMVLSTEEI